jgi:hypothetical protein
VAQIIATLLKGMNHYLHNADVVYPKGNPAILLLAMLLMKNSGGPTKRYAMLPQVS